ncbi:obscurin, partial [Trichonephila clavata]
YKGKKELSSEDVKIKSEGSNHSLVIDETTLEDSGTYICKAKNKVGEATQQATVTVKSRKDTQAPMFITHLYDQTIVVDDSGRLEAKITGKPDPEVTWYREEEELKANEKTIIKSEAESNTYTLTLRDLKIEDTAKYTCKAVNKYGEAKETAQITIKEPVAPHIEELEDVEVRYGAPARLKAKISGFPKPDVKWSKDGNAVKASDLFEISANLESKNYALAIKSVKSDEVGRYSCVASNQAGETTAECSLSIKAQLPVFVRDPKDQSLDIGEEFKFEAEVHGYPSLEITWLKDNKPIETNSHLKTSKDGDVYRLVGTIKGVDDAGIFTCKAVNKAGEDSRKATLKISDFAPKITEKLPSSVDLTEGEPLNLKAKISGKPVPEIKWVKDGKPLRPNNRIKMSVSPDGTAELSIADMTHDDAGIYKVVATNDKGQTASEANVGVAFRPKTTKPFVGQLHAIDAVVGKPVVFEAKVTGNPKPKIEWFKNDNKLESGPHVKLSEEENKAILIIEDAKLDDAGEYKLTATNDQGEDSSSAVVKVSEPGKKPVIVKELKAGKVLEGDEAKLQVVVSGQPMPTVAWMHNGRNVMEGQHCTPSMEDNGLATLTIHEVKCEDGGMYTVIAANNLGKAVSEAPIIVTPRVKIDTEKKPTKVFEFLKSLMPQLVPEGKPCTLEAQVTTDPKPISVKWTKDGKEIPPSERLQITEDADGTLKLYISNLTPGDRGKYAVIVSDGNVEIKSEAMVNMLPSMPGMSGNKPAFIKGLEPLKVNEGETIKLQAELQPNTGCTLKWMKDGDDIVKNDRTQILEQPSGAIALIIEAAVPEDSGKYVVIATNDEGKTRSSAMVAVVGDGFKLPEIVESLKPSSFVQGEPGKLTAKIDGEPKPDVKWLRDGVPLEPSDRIKMSQSPDGTVTLDIAEVKPEDAGKYTLLISNVGGEMRSSANVEVIQSPLFLKPLEAVTGVVDCPAKLECKISGDPIPDIKWTKDGNEVSDDDANIRKRQLPSGEVALVFDKCKPENAGDYTCTATNKHGEKSCSAPLKVISKDIEGQHKSSPSFVTPLTDLKVQEGDTFKLEAMVSGNPIPEVRWFLDDQPISISDTILPTFDGKKATLKVYRCNPRHEGVYECRATNNQGDASSKGKVFIQPHTPPKFIERLSDMQFLANQPMKLMCRVEGVPEPVVDWYFNRNKLDSGVKYSILREGDKCILTVPHPRPADSGIYECRARNEVGKDSCNANIAVSGADTEGEPAMFLKKLKDSSVLNGMSAKLTACICGTPKPEVKWFKDGTQLSPHNRLTLEADPNGVIRLIIRGAQRADAGTYRVSISNKFGSDTCTAVLGIEGEDKPIKPEVTKREITKPIITTGPPSPLPHAPYIFKMTDDTASLGWRPAIPQFPQVPYTYRLELCRTPDGQWSTYKSGIKDSSCDVRDLAPGVDYMFRVRVENRYGASEPSPYVTAHRSRLYRPFSPADFEPKDYDLEHLKLDKYAAAPRFLRTEEDCTYAIRGHPARVEFWVYGCPQPKITWSFNNVPVEAGKYDFLEDRNGQVILFITRMGDDDVGTYTCKAVNEHGEAQRKIKLLIADTPVFTKRLEPQTIMIRKGGEFRCRAIGVPYPKIKWFKDWHPLSESSRIHIKWEEPDTCILTLNDSILKDGALYTCTATNIAGTATTSAMLNVEECENEYHILTYKRPPFSKPNERPFEDFYDIGDELGRGTQGITYHVVERKTGRSLAAKVMHGTDKLMDFMTSEMDIMNQLCHPRLVRLWDAHQTKSSLTLATDLCGGGELLPNIIHRGKLTESIVAHYIKQILEGLQHMHEKNIAHLGLTIGDVLLTRLNCDNIKIADFGLATRLYSGREFIQEYGHPEFVAPEIANKQPVSLAADMWSVGIIAYILLVGESPFLRENDRETLKEVQRGMPNFFHDNFAVLSDDARDFVAQLLQSDPSKRLDVNAALKHKWLDLDSVPDICDELEIIDNLRDYYKKWRSWYSNASCRWFFRRRTLESCFTHPSRMIYPPNEEYTPPATPDRELDRSRVKPAAFDDVTFRQRIEREAIDPRSESHYQNGPDTFLLPLRDPDFPVRIRRYLKVGANRSPILANHLRDKHWGYSDVAVKERRKFVDVMDEEIDDEKKGVSQSANLRLRHEVGTVGSGYEHIETRSQKKRRGFRGTAGTAPFFREKIKHAVVRENEDAEFQCRVTASPEAQVSWFRNDGILIESSRIIINKWSDGRCSLTLRPAKAYDVGVYKCVARNPHGVSVCRARLNLGSVSSKPDPPKAEKVSDTEVFLTWMPPRFDGYSPTFGYALECKEEGSEAWTKVANNISHEFYLVRDLKPATTYYFHVCAVNKFGWSEFGGPSEPIMTLAESAPKIELGRAEKFQQDQTDSGQELILDTLDQVKLDYAREDEPVALEEAQPTDLYNYISEVSKGRFSLVMKVWHKKVNGTFVGKACDLTGAAGASAHKEFEIYSSLQHEKIANLHSASVSKSNMFFIMEKLSGLDVISYLSMRPLYTEEIVSKIINQVIDALEYLHFRGICYFELQPDNVVMEDRHHPNIKLVDFGSAQFVPEEGAKVQVHGNPEYLAPEVLKGEEVHTPADIWGVGVLTYILLSGVSPFAGDSDKETRDNVLYVRYHFDHLYKEATPEATHFLMQLFKRTPQKRPTAEECLENKWLLPNEFMIKKREHAVFLSHHLKEFSEQFHSLKSKQTPTSLLNIFGKPETRNNKNTTEVGRLFNEEEAISRIDGRDSVERVVIMEDIEGKRCGWTKATSLARQPWWTLAFLSPVPYPYGLEISVNGVQALESWSSSSSTFEVLLSRARCIPSGKYALQI